MKLQLLLKATLLTALLIFAGKIGWAQTTTTVFTDNFDRGVVISPISNGGTPIMTWTSGSSAITPGVTTTNLIATTNYAANIYSSAIAGVTYFTGPLSTFSSPFSPLLNNNTGDVTWTFNMKTNRTTVLSGFGGTTYGGAVILGMTGSNPTSSSASGYAVILVKGAALNAIKLVRFTGGFVTANLTTIIGPSADLTANVNYTSVKVVYTPSTDTWSLYVRDDLAVAVDPASGVLTQVGSSTIDNTFTSTTMSHCGFLYSHSTSTPTSNKGIFDNFSVTAVDDQTAANFTAFNIPTQVSSVIDKANHTIVVTLPYGTNVASLTPAFALSSPTATAKVGATPQISGVTTTDFSSVVTYTVTSANTLNNQDWTIIIKSKPADPTSLTASGFTANWASIVGAVSYDVNLFINGYLVKTTSVSALTADITGLSMGTDYIYQVVAKSGDGTILETSVSSSPFKTLTLSVSSINTNFNDGTWGRVYPTPSTNPLTPQTGSYPSYWVNGYSIMKGYIYGTKSSDEKGNTEQNVVRIDKNSYLELPTISSPFEQIEIHAFFGSGDKIFNLQELQADGTTWTKVGLDYTWNAQSKLNGTDSIYYIALSRAIPTKLRIVNMTTSGFNISKIITRTANPVITLDAPVVGEATLKSNSGFTANWTPVANATGYRVALLNSTNGFLDLSYTVSGQAAASLAISGMDTITVNSYKVSALGDDVTYLDSYLSLPSAAFELRLATPDVGVATDVAGDGFTANWTAISNASGYDVLVYQGLTLISTTNASGQATASFAITGLSSNTAYTYTVIAKGDGSITLNSLESGLSASFTTKMDAEITLADKTVTYNSLTQAIDAAVTVPAGLTINYLYNGSSTVPTAAGIYQTIAVINDLAYVGADTATLTINKAPIIVSVDANQTKVYGTNDPVLTYTVSPALETGDAFTGLLVRAAGENAGNYEISQGDLSAGSNYTINFLPENFAIAAKSITVTADANKTKVYGSADPVFTYTIDPALESGDAFTGFLSRATGENVASYAIAQGDLSAGTNYAITFVSDNFSITAKPVTVTADAGKTKTYGSSDPGFTYTVNPALESGDAFTGSLSRSAGENVASYAISQGNLSAGTNYTITFVPANFTLTAKAITVTADPNQTKSWGTSDPALTYSVNPALESGDVFTGSLSRVAGEAVGSYAIQIGSLSVGSNYSVSFVAADFSITVGTNVNSKDLAKIRIYSDLRTIYIDIPALENSTQVGVYNILGKQMYQTNNLSQGMNKIETNLIPGTYIVKLIAGKNAYTQKVILQK